MTIIELSSSVIKVKYCSAAIKSLPIIGEGFSMSTQRQEEIPKWSKLGNSENSWYNIFRKRKGVISQGYSGKAQGATGLTDGSNLVYWATYTYTYK